MASEVGRYTYGYDAIMVIFPEEAKLKIGSFCSIARGVVVYAGGNHRTDWISTYPFGHIYQRELPTFDGTGHPKTRGDVIIGNDVWIGNDVTIMSGITIGDGAVLGAGAHVVRDVPPYCIMVGNPAYVLKKRFSDQEIEKLLEIAWWNWPDSKIDEASPLLCSGNIQGFFEKYG
jgi:acetyltransferase-like isoleucine patch superfamily enzyme